MAILNLYKAIGDTPLATMEHYRRAHPEIGAVPMVYAGRLDPMASGVLPVLTGEDRYALAGQLAQTKTYRAELLFGLASDTYDVLGRLEPLQPVDTRQASARIEELAGLHVLPLPSYSAYKIQGKPLHWWARQGKLGDVQIPTRAMEVHTRQVYSTRLVRVAEIVPQVCARIDLVRGDFRQAEARADWMVLLLQPDAHVLLVDVEVDVSSGTYVRSLAHILGADVGGALLFSLERTRVGEMRLQDSLR